MEESVAAIRKEANGMTDLVEQLLFLARGDSGKLNLQLHADRKLLKQALRALVDNAVKYTPENGTVLLATSGGDDGVNLRVADTGIGIPENEPPKIFNRFYRADKDRSREKGGSGLGLYIVKRIVDAHRGTVSVVSEKGKGTSFFIHLPGG